MTVYVVLGEDMLEGEAFIAKVFASDSIASEWADTQNIKQVHITYSVHERWVEQDVEYVSE